MPCTPYCLSVSTSMQNSDVVSVPPHCVVIERAMSSVHLFVMVSRMPELPFSSMNAMGVADAPPMVNVTICSSGNARPMPSTSTMGMPRRAAAAMGSMEFTPPASMGMTAVTFLP